jgi:ABC-type antimicrobial peptide transport system permease subunit
VDERYAEDRFSVRLAGAVGLMALCLASIGVCGSFAYAVRQQTREIGVRRALGGRPPGIILSIVRSAGRSLGIGLVTGLAGAALAGQVLRRSLFGLSPLDPLTYLAVTVLVAAAALAALAVPAWRATRIAPADVLRAD